MSVAGYGSVSGGSLSGRTLSGRAVAAAAVAADLLISSLCLDRFPIVGRDEPRIAAPAVKLATEGTLGSDLFSGYRGMERHHLVHMPVYPLLEAVVFRTAGIGVVQMRALERRR